MERKKRKIIEATDDKVWVTVSITVKTGDFENIKIEAGLSQTLKGNENPFELIDNLSEEIMEVLDDKKKEMLTEG